MPPEKTQSVTPLPTPTQESELNSSAVAALPSETPASENVPAYSRMIFSRTFPVLAGGDPVIIDPEEYGYQYFSPDVEYTLHIVSGRPVNLLVIDSLYADRFPLFLPEYGTRPSKAPDRTVSYSYGFSYGVPLIAQEDNIIEDIVLFTVPRKGKYLIILDPRFHGDVTWDLSGASISHDYFRTTLELEEHDFPGVAARSEGPDTINEIVGIPTGYVGTTKIYPLDEYGYSTLAPGDSLHISVSTTRPVNVLVLDAEAMEAFSKVEPVAMNIRNRTTDAEHWGYSYGEISANNGGIFQEDLSLDTEAFISIPKTSKYYFVIDPRFSFEYSSYGGYPSSYSEDFVTAKVYAEVLREGSAMYWKKVGDYSLRKGDYEEAKAYYDKSLLLDSGNPDTWYNLGVVLRDLGDYRGAITAFNETARIQPGDADVWEKIGVLYLLIENEEAARDAYNRSLIP
ncbi:hypothetical protein J2741_002011 [Methanolinea mesophila]|uniref:tetratricopeptide repeat protein n=1 Tax=Methanolinea mesophila TaxID=547055 RepID=UPI001AE3519A|nr:tetratricopeptide repeat protein [Methanolinea mesophila]MBP1929464.1 hypothetical protein [Methanolinea mesophila]